MNTYTQTYTQTDIRRAFENFIADLLMLASRTQAMKIDLVSEYAHDIPLMAKEKCLKCVHIQLYDCYGNLVRAHRYSVKEDLISDSQRPGENKWPCLPNGELCIIVEYSNSQKAKQLKESGRLKINWRSSSLSIDYSGMKSADVRFYSSNSYGLQRDTFVNL